MTPPHPRPVIEVAFGYAPTNPTPMWTGLTPRLRRFSGMRGRRKSTDRVEAGRMTAWLDNTDRALEPANAAGPYFGMLKPMRRMRFGWVWPFDGDYEVSNNILDADQASFETSTAGWVPRNDSPDCTLAVTTDQAQAGSQSLEVTATAAGTVGAESGTSNVFEDGYAVAEGVEYTVVAYFRAKTVARTCVARVRWFDIGGTEISADESAGVTSSTSAWTKDSVTATSPAGVAVALVDLRVESAAIGEVHYIDAVSFHPGSSTDWVHPFPGPDGEHVFAGFCSLPRIYPYRGGDAIVELRCVDMFRAFAKSKVVATYSSTTVVDQLGLLLTDARWPLGRAHRALGLAVTTVQGVDVDDFALSYAHVLATSEAGMFFADRQGRARLLSRDDVYASTFDPALQWGAGGYGYVDLQVDDEEENLWTETSVSAPGLATQVAVDVDAATEFFPRAMPTIATVLTDVDVMNDRAHAALAQHATVTQRISRLTPNGVGDPAQWPVIGAREVGDKIGVGFDAAGLDQVSVIEGIEFSGDAGADAGVEVSWWLSSADGTADWFVWDDDVFGVADVGRFSW